MGLTERLLLRMTAEERALIEAVQDVYGRQGVRMSLNETLRHLVRRGGIVLAHTVDEAEDAVRKHVANCEDCARCRAGQFGCPEGLYLHRNHRRVIRAHSGALPPDGE